jgi:hypothetical protein
MDIFKFTFHYDFKFDYMNFCLATNMLICITLGILPATRYPNPNYPEPNPNYPNPYYPMLIRVVNLITRSFIG